MTPKTTDMAALEMENKKLQKQCEIADEIVRAVNEGNFALATKLVASYDATKKV